MTTNNTLLLTKKNCNIKSYITALLSKLFMLFASLFLTLLSIQSHSQPINNVIKSRGINPEHTFKQKEKVISVYADKNFVVSIGNNCSQIWKNINSEWQEIAVLNDCYRSVTANNISTDGGKIALLSFTYTNDVTAEIWENTEKYWQITGEGEGVRIYFNPKNSNEFTLQTDSGITLYNLNENNKWEKNTKISIPEQAYCGGYSQDGKRLFFACENEIIILQKDANNNYIMHRSSLERADKIFLSPVNNEFIVCRGCHFGFANALTTNTFYITHGRFNEEDSSFSYNYFASFTGLSGPKSLDFSSNGNEILVGDEDKLIIFKRQENNIWEIAKGFAFYNDSEACFSADGTSIVYPDSLTYVCIYIKNTDGKWVNGMTTTDIDEPLANTEVFTKQSKTKIHVPEAIFTPDSKQVLAVANTYDKHGYISKNSDVIILEKYVSPNFGGFLKNRGRLIFNKSYNAKFHLNKHYIIAVENKNLEISIYNLDKLTRVNHKPKLK